MVYINNSKTRTIERIYLRKKTSFYYIWERLKKFQKEFGRFHPQANYLRLKP